MLYLLYLRNGFIKKFPLEKKQTLLGRSKKCDFFLDEAFVSKEHAQISVYNDYIEIEDLGSTNGVFTEDGQTPLTYVKINQWFRIGFLKFFLKEGNANEFTLSDKIQPLFNRISTVIAAQSDETIASLNFLYTEPLVEMLQIGFSLEHYGNLFQHAEKQLKDTLPGGCLILASKSAQHWKIDSEWNNKKKHAPDFDHIIKQKNLLKEINKNIETPGSHYFCSFPIPAINHALVLVYISESPLQQELIDFLESLSLEISVIHTLHTHDHLLHSNDKENMAPNIITTNPRMLSLLSQCKKIAASNLFVLIEGETGTGKELFGRFIHYNSRRSQQEFIGLNCAAIPENLMEVELFGHEKGAFTDASSQRKGKLELASGGTLVLDEIGDMPLNLQAKLLRTIQENQFYRVGGNQPIKVDLRIICLTNKNVKELMQKNLFREDLYYRIAHVCLKIPPLRERKEDIVPLINHFMKHASEETGIIIKGFSENAIKAMETYNWPGNIREFENEMFKILNLSENNDIIDLDMLKEEIVEFYLHNCPESQSPEIEKKRLIELLEKHKWNKSLVAKDLNVSRTTLYEKLKKFEM